MPFTLAHPAIILPLKFLPKKWISLTALIVGSVMPDLESFIKLRPEKNFSHTWMGFLYLGIPAGLLLSFFFHNVIRDPLIHNLPSFLQKRFLKFKGFNWTERFKKNWVVVTVCLIIGGASHFFWDSFSDPNGWFMSVFPQLKGNITRSDGSLQEIPYLIQYINTILGVLIIFYFVVRMPTNQPVTRSRYLIPFWFVTTIIAIAIFAVRMDLLIDNSLDGWIITFVSAIFFGLCTAAFIFGKSQSL